MLVRHAVSGQRICKMGLKAEFKEGEDVRQTCFPICENPKSNVFLQSSYLTKLKNRKKSRGHSSNLCATAMHKLDKFVNF